MLPYSEIIIQPGLVALGQAQDFQDSPLYQEHSRVGQPIH